MAVACEKLSLSTNMDPNQQFYNNQQFQQGQQGYFDPSQFSYPPPSQFLPSSVFQPFHLAGPPQYYQHPQNFNNNNNSQGGTPMPFHGQEMNQQVGYDRGHGYKRGGGTRGKARNSYNSKNNPPKSHLPNPEKVDSTAVESKPSDSVDEYLQSYIDGAFDSVEPVEKESKNKSKGAPNQQRKNGHHQGESKYENRGNYKRQQNDNYRENIENNPHYYGNRGGRGRGRYEGSRSYHDQERRSFSSRNRKEDFDRGRDYGDLPSSVKEKINERKYDEKVDNSAGVGSNVSRREKEASRENHNNRRGQRSERGRQSYQGRSFQGRQQDDDYDPQNEIASDNAFHDRNRQQHPDNSFHDRNRQQHSNDSFHDRNRQQNSGRDKYRMQKTFQASRGQGQRPKLGRTISGKVDESQRGVLIEQLTNSTYECMVCCETVRCQNAIWNCSNCFHVFHLRCVKKWARSCAANEEAGEDSGWRCPACQNPCDKFPSQYRCFCGKIRDPEFNRMEIPHSCGEMCRKKRTDNCPHPCNILCHPGPCPPCNAVISRSCDCGKNVQSMKCSAIQTIKCEAICGKQLNCGKHFCKVTCHAGSCSMCEEVVVQECYKGHISREVVCGSKESFQSSFSCNKPCQKTLECGNHTCEKMCHDGPCVSCSLSPSAVLTCPCGATSLSDLSSTPRNSCLDPVPTCEGVCNKVLNCGPPDNHHTCKLVCHEGECDSCPGETLLRCRCGALEKEFPCTEAKNITEVNPFCCDKRCNKKRLCGRHKCLQTCCVLEKENHFCDVICGKKLSCGLHKCDEPCHRGNCPPCLLASFEELTCYCGSEVKFPPVPCGTRPPECFKTCTRTHACSHTVRHNCHSDENCPPCTELTSKYCMGKHVERKNIPCHISDITCGMPCNKDLPCGTHKCLRTCHKDECQDQGTPCVQPCSTPRSVCGHPCGVPCHSGKDCPALPCKSEITIKCPCGRKTARQFCMAGGSSPELEEFQKIAVQSLASAVGSGQAVDMSKLTSASKKVAKRQLECDGECAVIERNRRMALVLEIKNPDLSSKLGNPSYNDFLKEYAKNNPQNVASIDKAFSNLVQNAKGSKHPHRSHQFPPMNRDQRRVVHELAEFYGCQTQSYDTEPKKNVVATAYKEKCWLPSVTLTALIQRELHPKAPTPIPHVHDEETLRKSASAARQSTSLLPGQSTKPVAWALPREATPTVLKKATKAEKQIDYFDFSED